MTTIFNKKLLLETWRENKLFLISFISVIILALILIPSWFLYFRNIVQAPKTAVKYELTRQPHKWVSVPLEGKMRTFHVNRTQYVQQDNNGKNQYCFKFIPTAKNGNIPSAPAHTMRAVLAFGDTKSRNFTMQNMPQLSMGVRSAYMNMEFCFLQTQNEYSVLAVEALAEVDYNVPSKTWDAISELMAQNTAGLKTREQRLSLIMSVLSKLGVTKINGKPEISEKSISNGSFYQFGYMMSEIQRAAYVPAIIVDSTVKNSDLAIYDPDSMWKYIKALPNLQKV